MSDPHNRWDLSGYTIPQIALEPFSGEEINTFKMKTLLRTIQRESRAVPSYGYSDPEWLALCAEAERRVKAIMATREHLPNKAERKSIRIKRMHEKQYR